MDKRFNKIIPCFYFLILFIFFTSLITSCSTTKKRKDGPPKFYVDETKIPNAVPKIEPLAKYGNMPFYRVFGQRYYVMKHFKNYREVGTASWYGTMFHNRRTSSGEKYDMLGMTAAHRTLPLPTYVEVTNLNNNKKIIVKVNDRGPFASDRIIDLSYVAAKKLGMLGRGTTRVEVKAIDPRTYGKPILYAKNQPKYNRYQRHVATSTTITTQQTRSIPHEDGHRIQKVEVQQTRTKEYDLVYLQVGAFRNKLGAMRLKDKLQHSFSAPIQITYPSAAKKFYRVHIGPLHDLASVNEITKRLKSMGIKPNKAHGV